MIFFEEEHLMKFESCGISDVGLFRKNNEDAWAELPKERIFMLADGMGGHQAGEVAARSALHALVRFSIKRNKAANLSLNQAADKLKEDIAKVNAHVFRLGRKHPHLKGMGTTLCVLAFHKHGAILAHVGDSRIYRLRGGRLHLLTQDHSLLRELIDLGQIGEEGNQEFYYNHIITKAIGTEPKVVPSVHVEGFQPLDKYLLCTDGLTDILSAKEIEGILLKNESLSESCIELVNLSKKRGGHDNITLVLISIEAS
jgi:serine/threonine protein phosphatase PrpC